MQLYDRGWDSHTDTDHRKLVFPSQGRDFRLTDVAVRILENTLS